MFLDIRDAMDNMERTEGVRRFVLAGLCSGADNSFGMAERDERVVGAVLLDGYAYPTARFYLRYYGPRVFRARSWLVLVRRSFSGLAGALSGWRGLDPGLPPAQPFYVRQFPPNAQVGRALLLLIDRRVRLFSVHSSGMEKYSNYREQFRDTWRGYDLRGAVETEYVASANHTFTERRDHEPMIEAVAAWMRRTFAPLT